MKTDSLIAHADNILKWLESVSDDELFSALSKCEEVIYYALNHEDISSYIYSIERLYFDKDYFNKLEIAVNTYKEYIAENDEYYLLAA